MSNAAKTVLVAGATGQQGGAVVRQLLKRGWKVRAMSRDLAKPAAQSLAARGVEVVQGNMNEAASLTGLLEGVYGVFSVQNFWESGPEGETRQGKTLAEAAHAAGVQHLVYSSVGGAERDTGIAHFESKREIEKHIEALGIPATVLRPVFFMENFSFFVKPQGDPLTLTMALQPDTKLQLIAAEDIGAFVALAFEQPENFLGQALEIAGDALTLAQITAAMSRALGQPILPASQPVEQLRQFDKESARMFDWFNQSGYQADIPALRKLYPELQDFESWLARAGWGK